MLFYANLKHDLKNMTKPQVSTHITFDKIYFYPTIFNEFCIVVLQICMIYLGHTGLKFVKSEKGSL